MKIKPPASKQPIPPDARLAFRGKIFEVYQWDQRLYDGTSAVFEKVRRPATVNVLPVVHGKIILTKQEQPGSKPFIGAIGGVVEEGDSAFETAKRELLEEAGYEAKKWVLWNTAQLIDKVDWEMYTFIAKGCRKAADARPDAGEKIRLISVTFDEFISLVAKQKCRDIEIALKVLRARCGKKQLAKMRKDFTE